MTAPNPQEIETGATTTLVATGIRKSQPPIKDHLNNTLPTDMAIALGVAAIATACSPLINHAQPAETTPVPAGLIPTDVIKVDKNTPAENIPQELQEQAVSFYSAAQEKDGLIFTPKAPQYTQKSGNLEKTINGVFGTHYPIPADALTEMSLPDPSTITEIKFGERQLFIKQVTIPTTSGENQVLLFAKFDGKWRQLLFAQGGAGLEIFSNQEGVVIQGLTNLYANTDPKNPIRFNALLTVNDPGVKTPFKQAIYPKMNEDGTISLVYRGEDNEVISGEMPDGLFSVEGTTPPQQIPTAEPVFISYLPKDSQIQPTEVVTTPTVIVLPSVEPSPTAVQPIPPPESTQPPLTFEEWVNLTKPNEKSVIFNGLSGPSAVIIDANTGRPKFISEKKDNEWVWKSDGIVTELLASQNILFGFTYTWSKNPYSEIVRPPDILVVTNSKVVSPEDSFYVPFIFETPTRVSWKSVDEYINFIKTNNLNGGAPIIVGQAESQWVIDLESKHPDKNEAKQFFSGLLYQQTYDIVNHCKTDIHEWTINEIMGNDGALKNNIWSRTIGPDYVEVAVKAIREADPNARIVINEYAIEYNVIKEKSFYNYIVSLKNAGVLKDGDVIGIQGHNGIDTNITTEHIKKIAQRYIDLGLKVRFTELDVFDVKSQDQATLKRKASVFMKFIRAALELNAENKIKGRNNVIDQIIVWGTTNSSSWIHYLGITGEFPLLFNDDGTPELTYYLIAEEIMAIVQKLAPVQ